MTRWWRWALAVIAFAAVTLGATMLSASKFDEARSARIAAGDSDEISVDSIYDDRIDGQYDPDYDPARYRAIAASFAAGPIHIDGYQAFDIDDTDLAAIRDETRDLEVPIYVAFLSTSDLDDADGEADLLAARIAAELPDDRATVLVIGNSTEAVGDKGAVRRLEERPETDIDDSASAQALTYVRALTGAEVEDPADSYSRTLDRDGEPIVVNEERADDPRGLSYPAGSAVAGAIFGILVGGGLGTGGIFAWRAWTRKRQT